TDKLCAITGGNPMYTVEYVRMLAEQAACGEVDPDVELTIPETVHGVIANRIDLLTGPQRMVLHAAAALGESVWPGAVAAMLGEDTMADAVNARRTLLAAAEAAFAVYAVEPALAHLDQALTLWPPDVSVAERLATELQRRRLEFLLDGDRFYREGGAKDLLRI